MPYILIPVKKPGAQSKDTCGSYRTIRFDLAAAERKRFDATGYGLYFSQGESQDCSVAFDEEPEIGVRDLLFAPLNAGIRGAYWPGWKFDHFYIHNHQTGFPVTGLEVVVLGQRQMEVEQGIQ